MAVHSEIPRLSEVRGKWGWFVALGVALLAFGIIAAGNLLWVVDLNRQSLDRVVPGIRAAQLKRLFAECNWRVVEVKYDQVTSRRFRHGTGLLRWRPDKDPRQCTFDQLKPALRPSQLREIFGR